MLGKGTVESLITNRTVGGYNIYKSNRWNSFDDQGLLKNIYRRPNETNKEFRARILRAKDYNSTKQGLINWFSDCFDLDKYSVIDKKIFFSSVAPLSNISYLKIIDPSMDYYPPEVTCDGAIYTFPVEEIDINDTIIEFDGYGEDGNPLKYNYSYEKTEIYDITLLKKWTLWKNPDQTYQPIWEANFTPTDSLTLKYQILDTDGALKLVKESCKILTRDSDGNIIES